MGERKITTSAKQTRLNREIKAPQVRLIDADNEARGVVSIQQALALAAEAELDLVEIAPNADPPVCKIMDYGKFLFEQTKKKAVAKKKQKRVDVKELKFRLGIGDNDYQVKIASLLRFVEQGHKVKITVRFRGREVAHQELGTKLLERLRFDVEQHVLIEQEAKFEGKQIVMVVAPRK